MELFVYLLQKEKPARYLLFLNDFMCFYLQRKGQNVVSYLLGTSTMSRINDLS